jgi:hypothetical protein
MSALRPAIKVNLRSRSISQKEECIKMSVCLEVKTKEWKTLPNNRSSRPITEVSKHPSLTINIKLRWESHVRKIQKKILVSSCLSRRFQSRFDTQFSLELDKSTWWWFDSRSFTSSSFDTFSKKLKTLKRRLISLLSCKTNVFVRLLKRLKSLSSRCLKQRFIFFSSMLILINYRQRLEFDWNSTNNKSWSLTHVEQLLTN